MAPSKPRVRRPKPLPRSCVRPRSGRRESPVSIVAGQAMPGLGRPYEAGQSPAWWQGPHGPPLERGCESQDVVMPTATNTYTTPVPADMRNAGIRQQNHPRQGCGSTEWPLELAPAQSMRRTGFRWSLAAKRQSHGYRSPAQSPAPPPHRWRLPPVRDRSVGRADAARCIGEERERRRKPRVPRPRALPMFAGQSRAVVHAKRRATTTSVYTCDHFPARLSPRAIICAPRRPRRATSTL
uniref:Uncharacterized protein n=1 Tax=Mycobacterium riyadhense TaxID=486698 RepID=A0A653EW74_9MYCO|nr:hypothetical protein BIN_B_04114 [Mycobacterium riyadhense]